MLSCKKDEFSLPEGVHYLNCAYMSPLPKRVEKAGIEGIRSKKVPSEIGPEDFFRVSDAVRSSFASLIRAERPDSVSLAPSVSYGMALAAKNLVVEAGQEVVLLEEQFPSHVYTWHRLAAERGLSVRTIAPPEDHRNRGMAWNQRILEAISRKTAAVCLPTVHWTDGTRVDLASISRRARDVDAAVLIDGTQSVGAVPFDVTDVRPDCLVCAGYKWLMGPYSTAMAYWSDRFSDGIPLEENWISRLGSENFAGLVDYQDAYKAGAVRFDVGERSNFILMPMMLEALAFVQELDPGRIETYCRVLCAEAMVAMGELGYRVESPAYRSHHLFGIRVPEYIPLDRLRQTLAEHRIAVSVRGSAIRIAPNVYNTSADMDALLGVLQACASGRVR